MTVYQRNVVSRIKILSAIEQKLQMKFSKITMILWLAYIITGLVLAVLNCKLIFLSARYHDRAVVTISTRVLLTGVLLFLIADIYNPLGCLLRA